MGMTQLYTFYIHAKLVWKEGIDYVYRRNKEETFILKKLATYFEVNVLFIAIQTHLRCLGSAAGMYLKIFCFVFFKKKVS